MKTLKRLLVGLGAVFACILVFAGFMVFQAKSFRHDHEAFVRRFMFDYARRWDASDVDGRLTPDFLSQIRSPNGQQALESFRRLGRLEEIGEVSVQNFFEGTDGKRAVFVFEARFEAAPTVVRLQVWDSGGKPRVQALHVDPSAPLAPVTAAHSAI